MNTSLTLRQPFPSFTCRPNAYGVNKWQRIMPYAMFDTQPKCAPIRPCTPMVFTHGLAGSANILQSHRQWPIIAPEQPRIRYDPIDCMKMTTPDDSVKEMQIAAVNHCNSAELLEPSSSEFRMGTVAMIYCGDFPIVAIRYECGADGGWAQVETEEADAEENDDWAAATMKSILLTDGGECPVQSELDASAPPQLQHTPRASSSKSSADGRRRLSTRPACPNCSSLD